MKIRILHCIETVSSGGVEQTLLTLIKGLDRGRFEHKIICTWQGGAVAEALKFEQVELISVGSFKSPFEIKKLLRVLQIVNEYKPHIIHGAVFEGMTMATVGGLLGKVPVIILEETSDPQNRSKKANWLLRQYSRFADRIQAISFDVGDYLKNITKINPKKIMVIPNGIPKPITLKEDNLCRTRFNLNLSNEDVVIGFVGRLFDDHKRVSDLIEAFSLLTFPNVKLLIVGNGKDKNALEEQVRNLNLDEDVIFAGYQSDPNVYYQLMDIFCIPSSREGFGLVAVEAMLHQLPVIATSVVGLKEVVIDGKTGFLVPHGSPQALANRMVELIQNPELRKRFGEAGYLRACENYSAARYCEQIEKMYNILLEQKRIIQKTLSD